MVNLSQTTHLQLLKMRDYTYTLLSTRTLSMMMKNRGVGKLMIECSRGKTDWAAGEPVFGVKNPAVFAGKNPRIFFDG